jgi:hypothetical protein
VDVCSIFGHTEKELADISSLIRAYDIHKSAGIVLAINARLLVKNMSPFDRFLADFPESQLLCWVGSGEPPISTRRVARIHEHFDGRGSGDRVGFVESFQGRTRGTSGVFEHLPGHPLGRGHGLNGCGSNEFVDGVTTLGLRVLQSVGYRGD